MKRLLKLTAECLLPPCCLLCEQEIERGVICKGCRLDLPWLTQEYTFFPWGSARALWRYEFPMREVIQNLKYHRHLILARLLGELLAEKFLAEPTLQKPVAIIPVPLHPKRFRERGFNQSVEIARVLVEKFGSSLRTDLVSRIRHTPPQASLKEKERLLNLKGAFAVRGALPRGRIVLLDDVLTTGATLSELAKTLIQAGAEEIEAWVCARA